MKMVRMFELSGVNYEEVLEQGDSNFSSSYREFELSGVRVIGIILYIFCHHNCNGFIIYLASLLTSVLNRSCVSSYV